MGIVTTLIILFGLTFIPRQIFKIEADDVSKITISNGETGQSIELTNEEQIKAIVDNLNKITYQKKGLLSIKGYTYHIDIYNEKGIETHSITVRGENNITYKNFHYSSKKNKLDISYIDGLFILED